MNSLELSYEWLNVGTNKIVPTENPFLDTDENVNSLNRTFDSVLRRNVLTKDAIKAKVLIYLFGAIKKKSQYPEFFNVKIAMKSKAKSIEDFIEALSGSQFDNLANELRKIL